MFQKGNTLGKKAEVCVYKARDWAKPFHNSGRRFSVLVIHRRAGKTTAALNHLLMKAVMKKDTRYGFIAPTYKQAKNVAWDILKQHALKIQGASFNESELSVKLLNNSKIMLFGADNPDSLRGMGLDGVVFDEYSQQPSNIFTEVIRPALADRKGFAIWIGTPKGRNEFFRLYKGIDANGNLIQDTNNEWFRQLLTVDDTGVIDIAELESARRTMSNDEFAQEWYCSFDASIKGAIYADEVSEARLKRRVGLFPYDAGQLVHTVWDLGKGANMAVGFYQRAFNQMKMIDYWEGSENDGLPQAIKAVKERPYVFGKHFAPHDINAVDLSTGKTRIEMARELDFVFTPVPNIGVVEGINAAKIMWSRLFVHQPNCQMFMDYISQYHREWDDNKGMFKDNPDHDFTSHAADQFRYAAVVEDLMTNESDSSQSVEYNSAALNLDPWH